MYTWMTFTMNNTRTTQFTVCSEVDVWSWHKCVTFQTRFLKTLFLSDWKLSSIWKLIHSPQTLYITRSCPLFSDFPSLYFGNIHQKHTRNSPSLEETRWRAREIEFSKIIRSVRNLPHILSGTERVCFQIDFRPRGQSGRGGSWPSVTFFQKSDSESYSDVFYRRIQLAVIELCTLAHVWNKTSI